MAPRKRSSGFTAEPVEQELPSSSKRRKQTTESDSVKKNESKQKSKGKAVTNKFQTEEKNQIESKSKPKGTSRKSLKNQKKPEIEMEVKSVPVEEMNIEQLLALGETSQGESYNTRTQDEDFEDSSGSDLSDFEEVKNADITEPVIPKEGVNITLDAPHLFNKHKKKGFDMEAHLKRQMNRVRKDLQLLMHKVHVLCWIAHLRFLNNTLNDPSLMMNCKSLIKSKNLYPSKFADLNYLEGILKWFHKNFDLKKDAMDPLCTGGLLDKLKYQMEKKQAFTSRDFIFIFIILLRVLGLKVRIVLSFQVLPVKPSLLELYGDIIKARSEKIKNSKGVKCEGNENEKLEVKNSASSSPRASLKTSPVLEQAEQKLKAKGKKNEADSKSGSDDEFESKHFKPSIKSSIKQTKSKPKAELPDDGITGLKTKSKKSNASNKVEITITDGDIVDDDDDDNDFKLVSLIKNRNKKKTERKSDAGCENSQKKKEGNDMWAEVFLEAEEKWISVDVTRQKIHCIGEIYAKATHPVTYILACNNDHTLKDVTKRYVPNWHSDTRKKRVDEEWWNDTMKPYIPAKTAQDREEDEDINRQLLDKPLPSSISEFKDHPLYALKRHLLKFEGIYPPDAPTLGFVRGEAVYARECVHTLHSREMWYKEARLVRLKEEPYKIVKARPKYDKMTGEIKKDLPLELFGRWQTEQYIPPIATDGKVPRNEYGNVDLFKPCMLPIGTVHLQVPNLIRIAKKLDIDCAPATVGFEFHSGGSHPVFDGFVVCEEFKDILLDAWNKEIDETSKKEAEKKEKRVYGNWKRLIRGLLIREKLKIKYAFGENSDEEDSKPFAEKASTTSKN